MQVLLKIVFITSVFYKSECVELEKDAWELGEDYADVLYGVHFNETDLETDDKVPLENPTIYQNVKRYYCSYSESDEVSKQLIFATNEWRFPAQDVNLTLSYPAKNGARDYFLTSMEVYLFYDGTSSSKGYITDGGIAQDFITMQYFIPSISRLYYQFRLRGVLKTGQLLANGKQSNLCNRHY